MLLLASSKNYRRQQVNRGEGVTVVRGLGGGVKINFGHYFSSFLKAELFSDQCGKCISLKISTPRCLSYNKYGTRMQT